MAFALGQWHAGSRAGLQIGPYEAARALRPDNPTVWKNLGVALDWRGDPEGAIAAYKEAIRLDPNDYQAFLNLGMTLRAKREWAAAIEACNKAVQLAPDAAITHDTLGLTLAQKGDRLALVVTGAGPVVVDGLTGSEHARRLLETLAVVDHSLPGSVAATGRPDAGLRQDTAAYRSTDN